MRDRLIVAFALSALTTTASADTAGPVVDVAFFNAFLSVSNSAGGADSSSTGAIDITTSPLAYMETLTVDEPRGGLHEVAVESNFSSTAGTSWTGSINGTGTFADAANITSGQSDNIFAIAGSYVLFTLNEPMLVRIDAEQTVTANDRFGPVMTGPVSQFALRRGGSGPDYIFNELDSLSEIGTSTVTVDTTLLLDPGQYSFDMAFSLSSDASRGGFGEIGASINFEIDFLPIPSPATAALLSCAVLASTRRRR